MTHTDAARAHIESYLRAWHGAWAAERALHGDSGGVDFARWGAAINAVDDAFFVDGVRSGSSGSFGAPPTHDPATEAVEDVVVDGDRATVFVAASGSSAHHHEFDLVRHGGWRIAAQFAFLRERDAPAVKPPEAEAALAAASLDGPMGDVAADVAVNGDGLFRGGRTLTRDGRETTTAVERVGVLRLRSGVIDVRDLGYDIYDYAVIARRVPPGDYPVEIVTAFGRVAAVRVVFRDVPCAGFRTAECTAGGHVVGVDAGNVAIVDAVALTQTRARRQSRLFDELFARNSPNAAMLPLVEGDEGVIVSSGFGDGGYPVYFGVDDAGAPVCLIVDFLVVAEWQGKGYANPA
jgi:hypothetical protein